MPKFRNFATLTDRIDAFALDQANYDTVGNAFSAPRIHYRPGVAGFYGTTSDVAIQNELDYANQLYNPQYLLLATSALFANERRLVMGTNMSAVDGGAGGDFTISSSGGGGGNSFQTIDCPSGTDPVADSSTDTLQLLAGSNITITGDSTADSVTFAVTGLPTVAFTTIDCPSGTDPVADTASDTLQFLAGANITVTGDSTADSVTFAATGLVRVATADTITAAHTIDVGTYLYFRSSLDAYVRSSATGTLDLGGYTTINFNLDDVWVPGTTTAAISLGQIEFSNPTTHTYMQWTGNGILDFLTDLASGSFRFYAGGVLEATIRANALTFETGANDPGLGWATNGQLDIVIAGTIVASFTSNALTMAGNNDISCDRITCNEVNDATSLALMINATTEATLTADTLTFEAGATDVGLYWGVASGQLALRVGSTNEVLLSAGNLGIPQATSVPSLRDGAICWRTDAHALNAIYGSGVTLWLKAASTPITSTVSVTTTTETTIQGLFAFPANFFTVGKTIAWKIWGAYVSPASPGTVTFKLKGGTAGATTYATSAIVTLPANGSGSTNFVLDFVSTVRSASGLQSIGNAMFYTTTTVTTVQLANTLSGGFDATVANDMGITATLSSVAGGERLNIYNSYITIVE